jgi:hypothetical protein
MRIITFSLTVLTLLTLSNCATIICGSRQSLSFNSKPTGASVSIDGNKMGVTPMVTRLKRGEDHVVNIELEGYQSQEIKLTKRLNPWFIGNIAIGGLIGIIVDSATGALYMLNPRQVEAELKGTSTTMQTDKNGIFVALSSNIKPDWNKIGQLEKINNQ